MHQQFNGTLIKRSRKEEIMKLKYRDKGCRNRLIKHNLFRIFKDFINTSCLSSRDYDYLSFIFTIPIK